MSIRTSTPLRRLYSALALLLLCACAPVALPPAGPALRVPETFPADWYRAAHTRAEALLQVDPAASLVEIEVRRGGSMARFGHDHLVAARNLQGMVAPQSGRADLFVALDGLSVDEPALRQVAGMPAEVSAEAIEGTRRNMLERVLEARAFPFALIHVRRIRDDLLALDITLHGVMRSWQVPARIEHAADGSLRVDGNLQFRQSDFGITPFSVLGGALQVEDALVLRFRVRTMPAKAPGSAQNFISSAARSKAVAG